MRRVASQLLYAEMIATFARKRREEPGNAAAIDERQQVFRTDYETLTRIALDDEVHRLVDGLLDRHPLRGADAVRLASATLVRNVVKESRSSSLAPTQSLSPLPALKVRCRPIGDASATLALLASRRACAPSCARQGGTRRVFLKRLGTDCTHRGIS